MIVMETPIPAPRLEPSSIDPVEPCHRAGWNAHVDTRRDGHRLALAHQNFLRRYFMNSNGIDHGCRASGPSTESSGSAQGPPDVVAHLAIALVRHVRELRRRGVPVPMEIDDLA